MFASWLAMHVIVSALLAVPILAAQPDAPSWRDDPAWHAGSAEWALYESERSIYGVPRASESTIFTNKQLMDTATTTKAEAERDGAVEVFKHNVSELFPTENYVYRFLTTSFVRTDDLGPYKIVASTQEDCGATYKQVVVDDGRVDARSFCYFPETGESAASYDAPPDLAFHDALSLTLRDYPFDAEDKPVLRLALVPDQTHNRQTAARPVEATVRYAGRETVDVPYGALEAHHLRVEHPPDGGASESDFWFAADPDLRHVLVQYQGPHGVRYRLKRLDWWKYWEDPRPE